MEKKKKPRICNICLREIFDKDNYCILTEFNEGNKISEASYHVQCFREKFMDFQRLQSQANRILGAADRFMGGIGQTA